MTRRNPTRDLVVDGLACFRLARLVTKDTFPPVAAARRWIHGRYPVPGTAIDTDYFSPVDPDETRWRAPDGRIVTVVLHNDRYLADASNEPSALGELISCQWCSSVWLAAGIVVLRRTVPGFWDPVARLLAFSAAAGVLGAHS